MPWSCLQQQHFDCGYDIVSGFTNKSKTLECGMVSNCIIWWQTNTKPPYGRVLWITQFSLYDQIFLYATTLCSFKPLLFVWETGQTLMSRTQFWFLLIACQKTVKICHARKLELLSPQNRYIGHQVGIWKINGLNIFMLKGIFYTRSCLNAGGGQS